MISRRSIDDNIFGSCGGLVQAGVDCCKGNQDFDVGRLLMEAVISVTLDS
jgi:hypothetical protein